MRIKQPLLTAWFVIITLSTVPVYADSSSAATIGNPSAPAAPLTLDTFLALVRRENPVLTAARSGIDVARGWRSQARLLPNPTLEVEVGDMATDRLGDLGESVNTFLLSQEFVTADKRRAMTAIADIEVAISSLEYEVLEREMLTHGRQAFFTLLAAQERVAAFERLLDIARRGAEASRYRVAAGDASPVDTVRAGVALSQAVIGHRHAGVAAANASVALQQLTGCSDGALPQIGSAATLYELPSEAESEASLLAALEQHPAARALQAAVSLAAGELTLARKERWPNIEAGFGIESVPDENDGRDESFVIELSLPLPVFDRNQGAIAAAKSAYRQAELQYRAGRVQLTTQLRQALRDYVAARQSTETYRSEVVPGAQRAFDLVKLSYEAGEINQLELLDAQQSLIEAELAYIDNLADLRQAQADLQGLTFTTAGNGTTQRSE